MKITVQEEKDLIKAIRLLARNGALNIPVLESVLITLILKLLDGYGIDIQENHKLCCNNGETKCPSN